jgi:hypothetical protein
MLRIGVDLDGVVADFRSAFRQVAGHVLHRDLEGDAESLAPNEQERVWRAIAATENWWVGIQPYEPDQIARLYAAAREGRWEIVFLTKRPPSGGECVQLQTQWWLEQWGYLMPAVVTVPGSRGELANALRLDLLIDDLLVNCVEVVSSSATKAVLMLRDEPPPGVADHALERGIGVVATLREAIDVFERLQKVLPKRRGRLLRLAEWFGAPRTSDARLEPRQPRPKPAGIPSSPSLPPGTFPSEGNNKSPKV